MTRLEMKYYNTILTFDDFKAAKIEALLFGKIDKDEYLTGEEILPSSRRQIIEQAEFTYYFFRKSFGKTNRKRCWCFKFAKPF